jgi:hypothetical protein
MAVICAGVEERDEVLTSMRKDGKEAGFVQNCSQKGRMWNKQREGRGRLEPPVAVGGPAKQGIKVQNRFGSLNADLLSRKITVGACNINGLHPMDAMVLGKGIKANKIDLTGVSETYLSEWSRGILVPECTWIGKNMLSRTRRGKGVNLESHGAGFVVGAKLAGIMEVINPQPKFRDMMWVRVPKWRRIGKQGGQGKEEVMASADMVIRLLYLSPNLKADQVKTALEEMEKFGVKFQKAGAEVVVVGDLNCWLHSKTLGSKASKVMTVLKRLGVESGFGLYQAPEGHRSRNH